ncbi:MAG: hypothetical protein LBM66_02810 [Bifidobacteriaceae bacterium]|jgi:hypothetical protein|nr:hypothetical protein [Bifidobacteriaceae bacterium]
MAQRTAKQPAAPSGEPGLGTSVRFPAGAWGALAQLALGRDPGPEARGSLADGDVLALDGRHLREAAAVVLDGFRDARAVLTVLTADQAHGMADCKLYVGEKACTVVETYEGRATATLIETAVVPVRLAQQVSLGPRPAHAPGSEPFTVHSELLATLFRSDVEGVADAVARIGRDLSHSWAAGSAAIDRGAWRVAGVAAWTPDELEHPHSALAWLDLSAGLLGVAPADTPKGSRLRKRPAAAASAEAPDQTGPALTLVPVTSADIWMALAPITTLDPAGRLAALHHPAPAAPEEAEAVPAGERPEDKA